jgi:hypothetical protein
MMLARWATVWVGAAIVMLAASLLVATPGALAQTTTTLLGVPVPDQVSGLSHEAPMDFEAKQPGMGYGVRFPRPDWTIDIYIYDLKMKSIPDDPASAAVQAALEEAKGEIANIAKQGDYAGLTTKDTFTIADSAGRGRFVCVEYNYFHKRRAVDLDSYLCLAGARGEFFQIRMDTVKSKQPANEVRRFVEAWARAWIPVLWPS